MKRFGARIASEWGAKAAMAILLPVFFCVGYFGLQHVHVLPARTLTPSWLDRLVRFDANWVYVYQSIYLLMPVAPWLASRREQLQRYTKGFFLLSGISFAVFLLFPVEGPRPAPGDANAMYRTLVRYEGKLNAFPSLHAGLTAYTVLFAGAILKDELSRAARLWLGGAAVVWCLAILYATMATKQHYAIDLPAGVFLAWFCHRWAWRRSPQPAVGIVQEAA